MMCGAPIYGVMCGVPIYGVLIYGALIYGASYVGGRQWRCCRVSI